MGLNKILLLTNKFPFGIAETFIEAEMDAITPDSDVSIIPTQKHPATDTGRNVPENVFVDEVLLHRPALEYPLKCLQMMFSNVYRKEVAERKLKGKVSIDNRIHLIGYFGRAKQIKDVILKKYQKELRSNGLALYSYWLTESSLASAMIKEETDCRAISRAHRTDLYDGHCFYNTIPAQRDAICGLDSVVACSKDGMQYLQRKYPDLKDKISFSYLGTKDYGFQCGDNRGKEFVIVSCSRLVPVKRVHLIAQSLSKISNRKIHWIHIGDGPERGKVENSIKDLPQNIRVSLSGNIQHEDVMSFYKNNDVNLFINVSESEGLPVSIMEIFSFGIPVIATDVGGTGEIVSENAGDLLDVDFDENILANLIEKYIDMDSDVYQKMRIFVRRFWEKHYDAQMNYKKFYEELLGR